jgi:hypothetical protein
LAGIVPSNSASTRASIHLDGGAFKSAAIAKLILKKNCASFFLLSVSMPAPLETSAKDAR